MKIFTIGFTKKSAETFFTRLQASGARTLVDVRLNNVSQLAGFAKRDDLRFFTRTICDLDYTHRTDLAPTKDLLDAFKKHKGSWQTYEEAFLTLIRNRRIEDTSPHLLDAACLLCSEEKPHHCHRRLVAEYLRDHWESVDIHHIP